jgi:hypothetical protein
MAMLRALLSPQLLKSIAFESEFILWLQVGLCCLCLLRQSQMADVSCFLDLVFVHLKAKMRSYFEKERGSYLQSGVLNGIMAQASYVRAVDVEDQLLTC